ncbi:Cro/Cl family transcriptional regulator [Salmonella enterica]|nr:Cro/Cl family transcriptional regulator [Salmonella enterica]ELW0426347.1 Cro/Cl family transcriptional regulator [Salmonella enterica]
MNKMLLSSALALSVISGSAMAAVTTGQLTFNWQAVVPSAPVTSSAWAFVDGRDIPFIPGTEQLRVTRDASGIKAVSVNPYDFFIVPVTGSVEDGKPVTRAADTSSLKSVNVYLASSPVSNGLVGNKQLDLSTDAQAAAGKIAININGKPLKVGASNPTQIGAASDKDEHVDIDMNASIAKADVADGASISFVAPVIFAVDI